MNLAIDDGDDTSIVSPFLMSAKLKVNFLIFSLYGLLNFSIHIKKCYQVPVFSMEDQGSFGSKLPSCSISIEILSGDLTNAI